jgi:diguanylate cyclase (GGDEF)-like protein/PAS domain S-box-containing protein
MWHALIANFAVVGLVVFGWLQSQDLLGRLRRPYRRAAFGAVMAVGSVMSMLLTVELEPGLFFDLRTSFVALSALLGGPVAVAITLLAAGSYRLLLGGIGAVGALASMGGVAALGLMAHAWLKGRTPGALGMVAFGLVTSLFPLALVLLLPDASRDAALAAGLQRGILAFVATTGALFSIARSRQDHEERKLLMAAIGQAPDYLFVKDRNSRFVAVNGTVAKANGYASASDMRGKSDFDITAAPRARELFDAEQEVMSTGSPILNQEELVAIGEAEPRWFLTSKTAVRNIDGEVIGLAGVTRDITERKDLEQALVEGRSKLDLVLAEMSDGIAHFDASGVLEFSNDQYRSLFPLTGHSRVPGARLSDILREAASSGEQMHIPADRREAWLASVMASLAVGGEEEVPLYDGRWLHIRTKPTRDGGATVVVSDITNVKRAEAGLMALTEQLRTMATTDALTGLLNRRGFDERLDDEAMRATRNRQPLSLIIADIDRFKAYNDRYGHLAGDDCLKQVAAALRAGARRPADVVARYGGEEMTLILPDTDQQGAWELAERLRLSVRSLEIAHAGSEKRIVTASFGVATMEPGSAVSATELVRRADAALYIAKDAGRDRVMGWGERHAARA